MPYHTSMKNGYEFVGSRAGITGNIHSVQWAHWINQYCKLFPYAGHPLDANALAGMISTENGPWDPTAKSQTDYPTTGSIGLGQFTLYSATNRTHNTGPSFQIYTVADQENPEKNIRGMAKYLLSGLIASGGNYRNAYCVYKAGQVINHPGPALKQHLDNFDRNYLWWATHGDAPIKTPPVKTADNTQAVEKAKAQKIADDKAKAKIADAMHAQDVKEQLDDTKAIAKAKLTNDAKKLAQAQATAKANALKRAQALAQEKAQKIALDKKNALQKATSYKSNNPAHNTPSTPTSSAQKNLPSKITDYSKNKVLGSGLSIFGALAIAVVIGNGFIPKETLE